MDKKIKPQYKESEEQKAANLLKKQRQWAIDEDLAECDFEDEDLFYEVQRLLK